MKKCLHLKKTKPHWKRKPPKVITWKERREIEKQKRMQAVELSLYPSTHALAIEIMMIERGLIK